MANVDWAVFSDNFEIDPQNRPCILGLFNTLQTQALPYSHPQLLIVAHISGSPSEKFEATISGFDPDGDKMGKTLLREQLLSPSGSFYVVHALTKLAIKKAGKYVFQVSSGDKPYNLDLHVISG